MEAAVSFVFGLGTTLVLGSGVSCALQTVGVSVSAPAGITEDQRARWDRAIYPQGREEAGKLIGRLEQALLFISFWLQAHTLIAGWFVFKLGTKWQAWQHVIKIPPDLAGGEDVEQMRVANELGTRMQQRFLIGSLYNTLCGFIGATVGLYLRG